MVSFLFVICLQNINDIRCGRTAKVPLFDLETGARSGFKELDISEDCGVVCYLLDHILFLKLALLDLCLLVVFTTLWHSKIK